MNKADFGIIGLGVMGRSLAKNIAGKGISVSVYNRTTPLEKDVVSNFLNEAKTEHLQGHTEIKEFVASLSQPRKILIMVSAGDAVDSVVSELKPLLTQGDIIMDGGNSHFEDTQNRCSDLKQHDIHFLGVGISGGESGALTGPSMMVGGTVEAYEHVQSILEAIAARDKDNHPCVALLGPDGSGHFVKTLHNGVEYAEMQLLAECYALLAPTRSRDEIVMLFKDWNKGVLSSYLLEITIAILQKKEGDYYLLDKILDKADSKGTGTWSSQAAFQLGVPATMIHAAVSARFISMLKEKRLQYSQLTAMEPSGGEINSDKLKNAYSLARIIIAHQGFGVLKAASQEHRWNLNLSEIARIWTEGCIIKSTMMEGFAEQLRNNNDVFLDPQFDEGERFENDLRYTIINALKIGIATPCMSDSLQYWLSMTSEGSPANLIQAQRDYFGAHTYKRIDKPASENFTTNWNTHG